MPPVKISLSMYKCCPGVLQRTNLGFDAVYLRILNLAIFNDKTNALHCSSKDNDNFLHISVRSLFLLIVHYTISLTDQEIKMNVNTEARFIMLQSLCYFFAFDYILDDCPRTVKQFLY